MLQQAAPDFIVGVRSLLRELEARGYEPMIREAWRSPEAQAMAVDNGTSEVKTGRHNEVDREGKPSAGAIDLMRVRGSDRRERAYEMALACLAQRAGLQTGIAWGLEQGERQAVMEAVARCENYEGKVGWDPLHVQAARQSIGVPVDDDLADMHLLAGPDVPSASHVVDARDLVAQDTPVYGDGQSPVKVVVFTDLQCPYCRNLSHLLLAWLPSHGKDVAVYMKAYPLTKRSRHLAEWVACVKRFDPKDVGEAVNLAFEELNDPSLLEKLSQRLNVASSPVVDECVHASQGSKMVDQDIAMGRQVHVAGTPTIFVNQEELQGIRDIWSLSDAVARQAKAVHAREAFRYRRRSAIE